MSADLERLGVVACANKGRDRLEAGELCGAPAALSRHELVRPAGHGPDQHRLQDPALAQRTGERLQRAVVEHTAGLLGVGRDQLDGDHPQILELRPASARDGEDRRQAAAHAALRRAHDAPARTTSLASSKYASDPAQWGSWCVTGRP